MITIFDLRQWWGAEHEKAQLEVFDDIKFEPIRGHRSLFVADVSTEEMTMLVLLGLTIDTTIATEFATMGHRTRILHKSDNEYVIIELNYATLKTDKS